MDYIRSALGWVGSRSGRDSSLLDSLEDLQFLVLDRRQGSSTPNKGMNPSKLGNLKPPFRVEPREYVGREELEAEGFVP